MTTPHLNLADLLREQNELDNGLRYAEVAVVHSDQEINPSLFIISRLALLRMRQAQGDWPQVWHLLQQITTLAEQHPTVIHRALLAAITAQVQVAEAAASPAATAGLAAALAWAQQTAWEEGALVAAYRFLNFIYGYEHSRIARAQIFIAGARATGDRQRLPETLAYLERQQLMAEAGGLRWFQIKIHLLQALAQQILGATAAAHHALTQALTLAEPAGYVRIFVDEGEAMRLLIAAWRAERDSKAPLTIDDVRVQVYVDQLLAAFKAEKSRQPASGAPLSAENGVNRRQATPAPIQNLLEPLSERELEVLQLIVTGLSNREIAERLIIGTSTVKTHVNRIFGKLAVQSRTQAIVRARELGLLRD